MNNQFAQTEEHEKRHKKHQNMLERKKYKNAKYLSIVQ